MAQYLYTLQFGDNELGACTCSSFSLGAWLDSWLGFVGIPKFCLKVIRLERLGFKLKTNSKGIKCRLRHKRNLVYG